MFYEVKIFNAKGELRKVLSPKKLSNRFWKKGEQNLIDFTEKETSVPNVGKKIYRDKEFQLEDSWFCYIDSLPIKKAQRLGCCAFFLQKGFGIRPTQLKDNFI